MPAFARFLGLVMFGASLMAAAERPFSWFSLASILVGSLLGSLTLTVAHSDQEKR